MTDITSSSAPAQHPHQAQQHNAGGQILASYRLQKDAKMGVLIEMMPIERRQKFLDELDFHFHNASPLTQEQGSDNDNDASAGERALILEEELLDLKVERKNDDSQEKEGGA